METLDCYRSDTLGVIRSTQLRAKKYWKRGAFFAMLFRMLLPKLRISQGQGSVWVGSWHKLFQEMMIYSIVKSSQLFLQLSTFQPACFFLLICWHLKNLLHDVAQHLLVWVILLWGVTTTTFGYKTMAASHGTSESCAGELIGHQLIPGKRLSNCNWNS